MLLSPMLPKKGLLLISILMALPSVAAAAGKYSWFSDSSPSGVLEASPSSVGGDVYRSGEDPEADVMPLSRHRISLFGDYSLRASQADEENENKLAPSRRLANVGVRWQHRMSSKDSVAVLAEQGETSMQRATYSANPDALDTRATLTWTRELPWALRPSLTGGVFLGDESMREETARSLGRRYYGFSVGGAMRVLESHTPYVSFRMQRSLYQQRTPYDASLSEDGGSMSPAYARTTEDSTRFAAGWRWQAGRGLSLQAEASYGLNFNGDNPDVALPERERSRVFFGTRFDFK